MLQDIHTLKPKVDSDCSMLHILKSEDATVRTADENSHLDDCKKTVPKSHENESVRIPVFAIGPVKINGNIYNVPIATRDEALVENLNGIARVLFDEGVVSKTLHEQMSTVSVVRFQSAKQTGQALLWLNSPKNFKLMKNVYENSCPVRILCRVHGTGAGPFLSIRFTLQQHQQDDSMEIRNVTKGAVAVLGLMKQIFDDMKIVSCTGDLRCSEDKSCVGGDLSSSHSRLMTMGGTGDCVLSQALISMQLIRKTLKCSLQDLIMAHKLKNLIDGSAGLLNPHAANIVSSVYIALGKNPVEMILRSSCTTAIKSAPRDFNNCGEKMHISCTFPTFYSSDLSSIDNNIDPKTSVQYKNITDNFKDVISTVVLMSELSQLAKLAANFEENSPRQINCCSR